MNGDYNFKNDTVTILDVSELTEFNFKYKYTIINQDSIKYNLEANKQFNINDKIYFGDTTLKMSYIIIATYDRNFEIKNSWCDSVRNVIVTL